MNLGKRNSLIYLYILFGASLFVLFVIWFIVVWRFQASESFIPLHYTIYFGFDRFGPKFDLFLFPTLGSIIMIVNSAISKLVLKDNKLWQGVLLGLTLLMELILLVSLMLALLKSLS
ncbi:hypothetical protein CL632_00850 [bacterium]|jgi:hypothetical protein|nr:hypothetical protein [bacterium]MDP6571647.1 hypothetical protein [Patescibacteria group bacterium]MDP6756162.1 hypothetical protein [Patescibacteria group bacterium]|tara:strand:- start:59217 stop:59567 length:351 start_codon:yes stop_codon:yes gene_type:complete